VITNGPGDTRFFGTMPTSLGDGISAIGTVPLIALINTLLLTFSVAMYLTPLSKESGATEVVKQ
jgi:hypothetical protein